MSLRVALMAAVGVVSLITVAVAIFVNRPGNAHAQGHSSSGGGQPQRTSSRAPPRPEAPTSGTAKRGQKEDSPAAADAEGLHKRRGRTAEGEDDVTVVVDGKPGAKEKADQGVSVELIDLRVSGKSNDGQKDDGSFEKAIGDRIKEFWGEAPVENSGSSTVPEVGGQKGQDGDLLGLSAAEAEIPKVEEEVESAQEKAPVSVADDTILGVTDNLPEIPTPTTEEPQDIAPQPSVPTDQPSNVADVTAPIPCVSEADAGTDSLKALQDDVETLEEQLRARKTKLQQELADVGWTEEQFRTLVGLQGATAAGSDHHLAAQKKREEDGEASVFTMAPQNVGPLASVHLLKQAAEMRNSEIILEDLDASHRTTEHRPVDAVAAVSYPDHPATVLSPDHPATSPSSNIIYLQSLSASSPSIPSSHHHRTTLPPTLDMHSLAEVQFMDFSHVGHVEELAEASDEDAGRVAEEKESVFSGESGWTAVSPPPGHALEF
ncbi:uncharacterized protein EV422DRAFT_191671 [Fimicolochytrium jonesii]|uniref:uncharacterized protein n=1 Tax=Fimicolochytrium jonesii TaxID=1396493 RepID=UPI0022FE75B1|nr:uncharacterized protein EV422DRAFT_191671 [Fimicolochytrium jonesii]KAI8818140.1 hypothetical protein EV422DRAFT_191671 [Fimicolochytrium jonesii]